MFLALELYDLDLFVIIMHPLFDLITLFFSSSSFSTGSGSLVSLKMSNLFNGCMYFNQRKSFRRASSGSAKNKGLSSPVGLVDEDDVRDFPFVDHDTDVGAIGGVNTNDVTFIIGEVDGFPVTVHVHHVEFVVPEITGHISPFDLVVHFGFLPSGDHEGLGIQVEFLNRSISREQGNLFGGHLVATGPCHRLIIECDGGVDRKVDHRITQSLQVLTKELDFIVSP